MTTIKAAAVQISPVLYSREGTTDKVLQKIAELGGLGVQFATFPETILPYYPYFSFVQRPFEAIGQNLVLFEQAVTIPSLTTLAIGEACRRANMVVSIGINERDGGTLYNTQLLFNSDGTLIQRRRKISPTHHERMIWGQGDGSGLKAVDSAVGRVGQLACWEHYNPLARYAMMADGEQIHAAMYPGSFGGELFAEQTEINIRQHALEFGLLRRQRMRLAGSRSTSSHHAGYRLPNRADLGRMLHCHCDAAGSTVGATLALRRGGGGRRPRLLINRQAQAPDGFPRSL